MCYPVPFHDGGRLIPALYKNEEKDFVCKKLYCNEICSNSADSGGDPVVTDQESFIMNTAPPAGASFPNARLLNADMPIALLRGGINDKQTIIQLLPFGFEYTRTSNLAVAEETTVTITNWDTIESSHNTITAFNATTGVFTVGTVSLVGFWTFGVKGSYNATAGGGSSALVVSHNFGTDNNEYRSDALDNNTISGTRLATATIYLALNDTVRFLAINTGAGAGSKTINAAANTSFRCWGSRISGA